MKPIHHVRRGARRAAVVLAVLGLAAISAAAIVAAPVPAGGHARIAGTSPGDGSWNAVVPDRVTVTFTAKPVTVEGDPLRVYDPSGVRIDDGVARLDHGGDVLSVGVPVGATASGRYAVAYHVVSADSHLVTGRFAFTVTGEGEATFITPAPDRAPRPAGPADPRPELAVAGIAAIAVAVRLGRSRTARRSRSRGAGASHPPVP